MNNQTVKIEINDRVCILTLNQPEKRNAMNDEMAEDFTEAIQRLKNDPEPKVLIVTGAGKAFSAGGNLQKMLEL